MSIVQMSVQAGMLIAAIIIVRAIALYRLPKTSFLLLWGIVVARMLIPFSLTSRWSVYAIFDALLKPTGGSGTVPSGILPSAAWSGQSQSPISALPGNVGEPSAASPALSISPLETLWIIGMVVLFVVFAVILTKNYWALRNAVPVNDNDLIAEWRSTHRLHRPLEIVRSAQVMSPASLGILRPRIIFPQKMDMDDEQLIRYILAHEYVHIRRFDMLWKLAALCAVCIHWFNPLAWVMLFLLNRDLELSCDEMVLRHFGGTDRASYAHSLIDMAERNHTFFIANHFSKNAVEERIIAVMKYKKSSVLAIALVLALAVGMTTAFATSASEKENPPAEINTATNSLFGTMDDANKMNTVLTDIAEIQTGTENLFGKASSKVESTSDEASISSAEAGFPNASSSSKTSIAAQSTISYTFGAGQDQTYYEKGTEIEVIVQNKYADIPLTISLVSKETSEAVDSQKVEGSEQTTVRFTVPADGDYFIWVKNESQSRTQEYSHMLIR